MTKEKFLSTVNDGIARSREFMVVKIVTEGNPGPEIIVNSSVNFGAKLAYYSHAYNDAMELITAKYNGKRIQIVDVLMTSNLADLNWFAY